MKNKNREKLLKGIKESRGVIAIGEKRLINAPVYLFFRYKGSLFSAEGMTAEPKIVFIISRSGALKNLRYIFKNIPKLNVSLNFTIYSEAIASH